jgi:hypothetical protein
MKGQHSTIATGDLAALVGCVHSRVKRGLEKELALQQAPFETSQQQVCVTRYTLEPSPF